MEAIPKLYLIALCAMACESAAVGSGGAAGVGDAANARDACCDAAGVGAGGNGGAGGNASGAAGAPAQGGTGGFTYCLSGNCAADERCICGGGCEKRPSVCPGECSFVCGCSFSGYCNACIAHMEGDGDRVISSCSDGGSPQDGSRQPGEDCHATADCAHGAKCCAQCADGGSGCLGICTSLDDAQGCPIVESP